LLTGSGCGLPSPLLDEMDPDKATLFYIYALRAPTIIVQVVDRIDKSDVGSLHWHNRLADRRVVFWSFVYTKSK
jgi:hypothetical protein